MTDENPIILFDGFCNLCNGTINFVIDRDSNKHFRFLTIQSEKGRELLNRFNLNQQDLYSVFLYENGALIEKSDAVLSISKRLDGLWPSLYIFKIIPGFFRDIIYNWIAKNRYKWFGKKEECRMPTPDILDRFL